MELLDKDCQLCRIFCEAFLYSVTPDRLLASQIC